MLILITMWSEFEQLRPSAYSLTVEQIDMDATASVNIEKSISIASPQVTALHIVANKILHPPHQGNASEFLSVHDSRE